MRVVKLAVVVCRWIAAMVCNGCLFFAFSLALQGVAQLAEGEGPETAAEVRNRLHIVLALMATGFGASLVFLASLVFSGQRGRVLRFSLRKAVLGGFVSWRGGCLYFCFAILAASLQARWEVHSSYYWLTGAAGAMALLLLGTAGFFADRKPSEPAEPEAAPDPARDSGSGNS